MTEGIFKKPLPGPVKHHHRKIPPPRYSNAATAATVSIFNSLNHSIFTFHHRLRRCFSKLFHINTISSENTKGYKKVGRHEYPKPKPKSSSLPRLLNQPAKKKKTIILDLDKTLVHSTRQPPCIKFDFMVRPKIEGVVVPFFVVKRPGVDEFLERIGKKYEVVVFTAGIEEYASQVLDCLDKKHVISHRLYRDSCTEVDGKYLKDLSLVVGKDLGNVVIVDDNPVAYSLQPENAVPIRPFVDDMKDRELKKLVEFFEGYDDVEDMRDGIKEFLLNQLV